MIVFYNIVYKYLYTMNVLDVLLDNESRLNFSWFSGFKFVGMMSGLPIYRRVSIGCENTLSFHIGFKNSEDVILYQQLLIAINRFKVEENDTNMRIDIKAPAVKRRIKNIKSGNELKVDNIEHLNRHIRQQYEQLKNQYCIIVHLLEELGCHCTEPSEPIYHPFPEEYYDWEQYEDCSQAEIVICWHDKTPFFQFIKEKGLLDRYANK
jgi:hypothetical protein